MPTSALHDEVLTHLQSAVFIINRKAEILYMNPAAERILTVSLSSSRGKALKELLPESHDFYQLLAEVFNKGRTFKAHEVELKLGSETQAYHIEMAPIGALENPSGAMIWVSELSVARALQEEHRLQDRLDMMGTLASGLAHEIRNPLGGIKGAAQMVARGTDPEEVTELTEIILSEVDRLNDLITELLNFSKPKKIKKGPVNIHRLLSEIFQLQQNNFEEGKIKIIQELDPSLPPVHGHGPSLKQALLNIIKNALEAMEGKGTLRVSTQFSTLSSRASLVHIKIQDTGKGIPKSLQKSLFTPFFTTKREGTGLGLMMVQRIIKEHGGSLKLESKPRSGTTFHLFLKLAT